jgi:hypothetical protein
MKFMAGYDSGDSRQVVGMKHPVEETTAHPNQNLAPALPPAAP